MDTLTFVTVLVGFVAVVGSNIGLFLWSRGESRADIRALETSTGALIAAINQERKDFHGRLCAIEAQRHGITLDKKEN